MEIVLQRKTDLAIRALRALDRTRTRVRGAELAATVGSSPQFLLHVMNPLTKAGWVDAVRGPAGGYQLEPPATDASVLDVIEAVEGPESTDVCVLRGGPCPGADRCALHDPWSRARTALMHELAATPVLHESKEGRP